MVRFTYFQLASWVRLKGYGRRWCVETGYSTFKRGFGDFRMARTIENINKEFVVKSTIFNNVGQSTSPETPPKKSDRGKGKN
jgi:hypothetical protein